MKMNINPWDYAPQILKQIPKGVLLTTKAGEKVDSMVIGWGTMGIQWQKDIFIVFVRQSRHTLTLLDKNPEFTINVPLGEIDKEVLRVCGTLSGRDMDKIRELGLHTVPGETVSVPAIKELPLTLECKVIYRQDQDLSLLEQPSVERCYKPGTPNETDFHTAYYGQITAAYILQD